MKARLIIAFLYLASIGVAEPAGTRNRIVRVVTISQADIQVSEANAVNETLERLDRASAFRPDIAALPELFSGAEPETVPGPITKRLARVGASRYLSPGRTDAGGSKGCRAARAKPHSPKDGTRA